MEPITVKVALIPGRITEVAVESGSTVRNILEVAEVAYEPTLSISVGGEPAGLDTIVRTATSILLTRKIKGA